MIAKAEGEKSTEYWKLIALRVDCLHHRPDLWLGGVDPLDHRYTIILNRGLFNGAKHA